MRNIQNHKIITLTNRRLKKVFDAFNEELSESITEHEYNKVIQLDIEAYIKYQTRH